MPTILSFKVDLHDLHGYTEPVKMVSNWRSLYDLLKLAVANGEAYAVVVPGESLSRQDDAIDRVLTLANDSGVPVMVYINPRDKLKSSAYYAQIGGILCEPLDVGSIKEFIGYARDAKNSRSEIILAIDDSRTARKVLFRELNSAGYHLFFISDGTSAHKVAAVLNPSVVVTDLLMPGMDGYELCSQLAASSDTAHIPVVVITSLDSNELLREGFTAGIKEFFQKPWPNQQLVRFIDRLIVEMKYRRSETALVLEDSPTIRRLVAHYLNKLGFSVVEFSLGVELVKYLQGEHSVVDLMVLDWELPDWDGLDLVSTIRTKKEFAFTPILMLTGRNKESDIASALRAGADDYVTKPFKFEELAARIQAQMRIKRLIDELHEKNKLLEELALTDSLTGLYNRRHFDNQMEFFWAHHERAQHRFSLMLIDVDHFKSINDTYGHATGDEVLTILADLLKEICRKGDLVARFGGEEFAMILPETGQDEAWIVGERLRLAVQEYSFAVSGKTIAMTVSVGVVDSDRGEIHKFEDMIHLADNTLYKAKAAGRNSALVYRNE
ncbi:diguanylate cyclase [Acanthopleuribacter pedis]|uniref:diguanylate cyclase n=1 Tax=Acanthopleuribacter pedis TaxID=442870 RepID=A0A8J7QP92_9BACT|nr:diguanylate cyclase [Acanthopleuribacter pedis]MBO1322700.1 diguanylate cyclase [Acanthopleuribacter pedis]